MQAATVCSLPSSVASPQPYRSVSVSTLTKSQFRGSPQVRYVLISRTRILPAHFYARLLGCSSPAIVLGPATAANARDCPGHPAAGLVGTPAVAAERRNAGLCAPC